MSADKLRGEVEDTRLFWKVLCGLALWGVPAVNITRAHAAQAMAYSDGANHGLFRWRKPWPIQTAQTMAYSDGKNHAVWRLGQTVESLKGLSRQICPKAVPRVFRLSWGAQHLIKLCLLEGHPMGKRFEKNMFYYFRPILFNLYKVEVSILYFTFYTLYFIH